MKLNAFILMASAALIAAGPAMATNSPPKPTPTPTPTPAPTSSTSSSKSDSNASAGALAGALAGSNSNATGGKSSSNSGVDIGDVGSTAAAYSGGNKLAVDAAVYGGDQKQSLTGGDVAVKSDNRSGVDASGNSAVSVDTSDRSSNSYSTNSRVLFIPPVVPGTPPSQVAVGNIIKETLACGPLQAVVKTPIVGTSRGLFSKSQIQQGFTYDLAPYVDKDGNAVDYRKVDLPDGSGYQLFGHQPVLFTTVVGIANGANIAIGGGSGGGGWGQAGGGTTSSMTQLVTNIQLATCEVGTVRFIPAPVEREVKKKPKDQ